MPPASTSSARLVQPCCTDTAKSGIPLPRSWLSLTLCWSPGSFALTVRAKFPAVLVDHAEYLRAHVEGEVAAVEQLLHEAHPDRPQADARGDAGDAPDEAGHRERSLDRMIEARVLRVGGCRHAQEAAVLFDEVLTQQLLVRNAQWREFLGPEFDWALPISTLREYPDLLRKVAQQRLDELDKSATPR